MLIGPAMSKHQSRSAVATTAHPEAPVTVDRMASRPLPAPVLHNAYFPPEPGGQPIVAEGGSRIRRHAILLIRARFARLASSCLMTRSRFRSHGAQAYSAVPAGTGDGSVSCRSSV